MADIKLYSSYSGDYNLVLAYPAQESFALSSLGYMWLFMLADMTDGINAKRISTDNTSCDCNKTDALAFSISFDFDYNGVLKILDKLKIPFFKDERNENHPLIFAGGPVITTNPRPYEKFFDFMLIGDGENSFLEVLEVLKLKLPKQELLQKLSEIEGVYIPHNKVVKRTERLENVIYTPIISSNSYFKNTFIIEVSRGCTNRCAFCTASYTNLPYRFNDFNKIIDAIELGLKYTDNIALLGAQLSAHPQFSEIMKYLHNKMQSGQNINLSISSLRTDAINPDIVKTLVLGGQKHTTIAIEAASERLRRFINKNITEDQIINAVKIAKENGLKGLKIYSMIGIPNENDNDIAEFLRLAKLLKEQNKGINIEFSFSSFVPKPQTPFQWEKRETTNTIEKRQHYLEKGLSKIGIEAKFSSAKWDFWQTVLSRADENIASALVEIYKNQGKLGSYKKVIKELGINIEKSIEGCNVNESLPWDIIESRPGKDYLFEEYQRLMKLIKK
ncbi:radical SAM protein [bacterium]|nr:radical SAM protein [bacterium]